MKNFIAVVIVFMCFLAFADSIYSQGTKVFLNNTNYSIKVKIMIRKGVNPAEHLGTDIFSVQPNESRVFYYGDRDNVYLNGIEVMDMKTHKDILLLTVATRGNPTDNLFNQNNCLVLKTVHGKVRLGGYNDGLPHLPIPTPAPGPDHRTGPKPDVPLPYIIEVR